MTLTNHTHAEDLPARHSDSEWLELFGSDVNETIQESYQILTNTRAALVVERDSEYAAINAETDDEEERWFLKTVLSAKRSYKARLQDIDAQLARLRRYLRIINGVPVPKGAVTSDLIQAAKEVPIETIFNQEFRRSGNKLVGLCPFHEEKTASFFIYKDTNRCYCFSCGATGNTVDSYMKLNNCSFNEAVLALTGA